LLDGLVESVEGGGAAVLVVGEAGIGKTALLTQVAEMVSHRPGMRVLRARGVESEAVLAFAAIADLLCPLHERFVELPQAQRQALEVCLALGEEGQHADQPDNGLGEHCPRTPLSRRRPGR
jgi:energy-coupling factor transporter ATP-binding protein EcfA2